MKLPHVKMVTSLVWLVCIVGLVTGEDVPPTVAQAESSIEEPSVAEKDESLPTGVTQIPDIRMDLVIPPETSDAAKDNTTDVGKTDVEAAANATVKRVACLPSNATLDPPQVELVNASTLQARLTTWSNVTARTMPAPCHVLLFYAKWCPFSAQAIPQFNALARAFPTLSLSAMDSFTHSNLNTQLGVVAVPTVLLFHNGKPVAKFNESDYTIEALATFLTKCTGIEATDLLNVTSQDFEGPIPSSIEVGRDPWLWLAWFFLGLCAIYLVIQSSFWQRIIETVQTAWREAQAQHEHTD